MKLEIAARQLESLGSPVRLKIYRALVRAGGHNILEPAAIGKAPVFGPHMDNFREIARKFLDLGAAVQVATAAELGQVWLDWLDDPARRQAAGRAARDLVEIAGAQDRGLVPSNLHSRVKRTVRMGTLMPTPRVSVPHMTFRSPRWASCSTTPGPSGRLSGAPRGHSAPITSSSCWAARRHPTRWSGTPPSARATSR